jgi:hypothetical protein
MALVAHLLVRLQQQLSAAQHLLSMAAAGALVQQLLLPCPG